MPFERFEPVDTDYYFNEYRWGPHLDDVVTYHYYFDASNNIYVMDGGDSITLDSAVSGLSTVAVAIASLFLAF